MSKNTAIIDLNQPEFYLNRELTWLMFNRRVLHEAQDARNPLLERLKFLAIVSSNLDEFFMKRIGGLKEQVGAGVQELTIDGRSPKQQIAECYEIVRDIERQQEALLTILQAELEQYGIALLTYPKLSKNEQVQLRQYYIDNIFPLVTPQSIDPAHPFPFISNNSLNLLVTLQRPGDSHLAMARVKVPASGDTPRFLRLPDTQRYVRLEEVMQNNLDLLFPDMEIIACECFHVVRNANTERDETNAEDLLSLIEAELRTRKFAPIVRMVVQSDMDNGRRIRLAAELKLNAAEDVFERKNMLVMQDLLELTSIENATLHYPPHHSIDNVDLPAKQNIFHIIREKKYILLHHPYEAFTTSVERFIEEASTDPKVRAIKMTIYRTSSDTKIIEDLIDAARNGKEVTVAVELKARFDEAANIRWASRLEEAGIHVTYGVVGYKTHCKLILVVRQDYNGIKRYAHIGTGNYHAGTAKIYTDLGMLTCDNTIGSDLTELFNYLTTGYTPKRNYLQILPAPIKLKKALLEKIEREAKHQAEHGDGHIQLKVNALEDVDITRALYQAAQARVKIDLIIRDTCRLRPNVAGLSETVKVISIVGRFLEHSRICYFHNHGNSEYLIGSADMMLRNLGQRVEVLTPVTAPELQAALREILDVNLNDQRSAWDMQADGSYIQRQPKNPDAPGCQETLMQLAQKRVAALRKNNKLKSYKRAQSRRK